MWKATIWNKSLSQDLTMRDKCVFTSLLCGALILPDVMITGNEQCELIGTKGAPVAFPSDNFS